MSLSGVLVIDKPPGLTSHDVVARVRRVLKTKKVGHAGTLDPDVTGVLVLCVGDATRLLEYATADDKVYEGSVCFGFSTDTDDASGTVIQSASGAHLTEEAVRQAAQRFVGEIRQQVPLYSAVHVDGKRAYDYARQGITVELPSRMIHIESLQVGNVRLGQRVYADFCVKCSKGTYVRALCRDWGVAVDVPAHLHRLRRTASGPFTVAEATPLEPWMASAHPQSFLLGPMEALRGMPRIQVGASHALRLAQGQTVPVNMMGDPGLVAVTHGDPEALVCVATGIDGEDGVVLLKPKKVFWNRNS